MEDVRPITREELLPYWNAIVYGICLYALGIDLMKSLLIMLLALVCVLLGYGSRWILRGGVGILGLAILIWIGAIPPAGQWHDMTTRVISRFDQSIASAR
jgi:hypothetical protein